MEIKLALKVNDKDNVATIFAQTIDFIQFQGYHHSIKRMMYTIHICGSKHRAPTTKEAFV